MIHRSQQSILFSLALLACLLMGTGWVGAASDPAAELIGVWQAKRNFGPEVQGTLTLTWINERWEAEIAGHSLAVTSNEGALAFDLPGGLGRFRGQIEPDRGRVTGHWFQPPTVNNGAEFASPVVLKPDARNRWRGEVVPLDDEFTFFLVAYQRDNGSVGAFLRNPDRNFGIFLNADRLEREGDTLKLVGRFLRRPDEIVLAEGSYRPNQDQLSFHLRGRTYDFDRIDADTASSFYARGKNPGSYRYQRPLAEDDGWSIGTLEQAELRIEPIRELIEAVIYPAAKSVHDPYIHGFLIARHGKLVLEEYFHGFHRDKPHDTRSASKSLTSTLVGAAIQDGSPINVSSSVYDVIYGDYLPADLDPRKKRMTLEHLLTMASGFDCDDRDSSSPGNEDLMQEQTEEPDWYRYTLTLPMAREPGEMAVYCSINSNLIGAVLSAATEESLPELFQRLIAEPLQIERYHMFLSPTGDAYMGGGIFWLPRDFMKLGQLLLDGGMWNGRRVVSEEWASRAIAPLVELRERKYGYQWWLKDYPYKNGSVKAFFAGGNGGQLVMGIPELGLVVAFFAGNYSDRVGYKIQEEFVPQYILPAVDKIEQ